MTKLKQLLNVGTKIVAASGITLQIRVSTINQNITEEEFMIIMHAMKDATALLLGPGSPIRKRYDAIRSAPGYGKGERKPCEAV